LLNKFDLIFTKCLQNKHVGEDIKEYNKIEFTENGYSRINIGFQKFVYMSACSPGRNTVSGIELTDFFICP
jgi:hypothetical protein